MIQIPRLILCRWCVLVVAAVCVLRCSAAPSDPAEVGFERLFQDDQLTRWDKVGSAGFSLHQGLLLCAGSGSEPAWIRSRETYENFVLRFQYRMAAHGNGGVFLHAPLHGRASAVGFLIRLSDDTPKSRPTFTSTGGLFGVQPPNCLCGLIDRWMDVEIFSSYPRLAVTVNGQLVQDLDVHDDPLLRYRPRAGFLGFQDCGKRVEYRNVRIKRLPGTEKEWVPLFSGDDLDGWQRLEGDAAWRVENGVLSAVEGRGYLGTQAQYRDFELRAYVQTSPGSNGGIFCRFKTSSE